ncbi:MAG: hypothetical protein OEV44_12700, partial [Spirochaetota bacterium]|nr:hypothetical protein [Spirochaetota bacterium]
FSGKAVKDSLDTFMDTNLIPTLKLRYSAMQDSLRSTFKKHNFSIAEAEIDVNQMHKVYHLCFMILEAKNIYKNVSHNDFNIAQIIINCWLAMEDDPLLSLQEFPNIELGNDFLSPFLTRYIQDFSHIADYLKIIKGFMEHLPQIIEVDDLLNFFKSKGVQKKTVETFLNHLPNDILKIQSLKHYYIISKSQIIKAIHYLYDGNFYKNTDSGRSQFEILAQAFRTIEQSTKDTNNVLNQLKTTSDEFKETKSILNKSDAYRMIEDKLEDTKEADAKLAKKKIPPNIPSKKIYTPKDFESLEEEDRDMLIKALNLMIIDCMDTHNNPYQFFIKRSDLNLDDARFFRGKPTYELICKRFNL